MALGRCIECGREVSTSAKKCPGCGKPSPTLTRAQRAGGWIFLGLVVVAAAAWLIPSTGKKDPGPPTTTASSAAAAASPPAVPTRRVPSEEAKKKQPKRREALDRLAAQGVFHGYLSDGGDRTFVVFRVGPAWRNLPLEQKRLAADIAFTYLWVDRPELESALLEDWRTGKSIGSFSPQWGLRLDD